MSGKYMAANEQLKLIDTALITNENYLVVYELIKDANNVYVAELYYEEGYKWFDASEWEDAYTWLQLSYDLNPEPVETIYYLARAYDRANKGYEMEEKAAVYYRMVIERFPDTSMARNAKTYMNDGK